MLTSLTFVDIIARRDSFYNLFEQNQKRDLSGDYKRLCILMTKMHIECRTTFLTSGVV